MISPLEFISHHPKLALVVNGALLFGAQQAPEISAPEFSIPLWIMQLFQIGAWAITIGVGGITLLTSINKSIDRYKKHLKRKKSKK